jgi:hypothetical protein
MSNVEYARVLVPFVDGPLNILVHVDNYCFHIPVILAWLDVGDDKSLEESSWQHQLHFFLWQRHPISLHVFWLYVKGLSSLLKKKEQEGRLRGEG